MRRLAERLALTESPSDEIAPPSKRVKLSSEPTGLPEIYARIHRALGSPSKEGNFTFDLNFMYVQLCPWFEFCLTIAGLPSRKLTKPLNAWQSISSHGLAALRMGHYWMHPPPRRDPSIVANTALIPLVPAHDRPSSTCRQKLMLWLLL